MKNGIEFIDLPPVNSPNEALKHLSEGALVGNVGLICTVPANTGVTETVSANKKKKKTNSEDQILISD
jgi:hypothetical protein